MGQSNKGVIAVIVGGCGLGLALGLVYLFVWAPMQTASRARDEIKEWGASWESARKCFLGAEPLSKDTYLTLLARDQFEHRIEKQLEGCVRTLKPLRREEGGSSEDDAIETAWAAIPKAVGKLAQAQMWRSAKEPNKSLKQLRVDLAEGIDAVEVAYLGLLKAAEMKAPKRQYGTLPALTSIHTLVAPKGHEGEVHAQDLALHNDSISYIAVGTDASWRALTTFEGTEFSALSPLALRAAQGDWGLWLENDGIPVAADDAVPASQLMAGPLDELGEPGGDGVVLHTLGEHEHITPYFAIGETKRLAMYRLQSLGDDGYLHWEYRLLSSEDGGKSFERLPITDGELWPTLRWKAVGSSLMWDDGRDSTTLHWQRLTADGPVQHDLNFAGDRTSMTWPPNLCERENRSWWFANRSVYTMGDEGRLMLVPGELHENHVGYDSYMRCTEESAVVSHTHYDDRGQRWLRFQRCTAQRCDKGLQQIPMGRVDGEHHLVFHGGSWKVLTVNERLVAVWSQGDEPDAIYHLEAPASTYGALSWGKALALLVWQDGEAMPSLLEIPAAP